jgi:GT2 family glycosyltransferase
VKVAAGVLHYRGWPDVSATLDALLAQTRQPDRLLVIDHASRDGSAEAIRRAYPQIELVELPENRGPTAGQNRNLAALLDTGADAVMILPHDFRLAPDALEHLAARLEAEPEVGAVGPLIAHENTPELIFYAGGRLNRRTWDLEYEEVPSRVDAWRGRPPHAVDWLEFGGILLRAEAARAAGFLPEKFYYWLDDTDYTIRLQQMGWRIECVPAALGWQDLGQPPSYIMVRNRLGLVARNAPRRMLIREVVRTAYHLARDAVDPGRRDRRPYVWPRLRGLVDFCRGRWGPPPRLDRRARVNGSRPRGRAG